MPSRKANLKVRPILNPRECNGYPSAWIRDESKHELNFYINKNDPLPPAGNKNKLKPCFSCTKQKQDQIASEVLACSLIVSMSTGTHTGGGLKRGRGAAMEKELPTQISNLDTSKPVIIICHGYQSWRNQMLLANLAARLSNDLSWHTLRFDFSGCGHSSGRWKYADYNGDYSDLSRVVRFVEGDQNQGLGLGCKVLCVIGHSQGSAAMVKLRHSDSDRVERLYVNLAGRFTVPNDFVPESIFTEEQCKKLKDVGEFELLRRGDRGDRLLTVTLDAVRSRNAYDISAAASATELENIHMLTIHGDADKHVPVENAFKFHEVIPNHSLHIIKGADHNFNGLKFMDDLVSVISFFLRKHHSM
jgi:pimeloyl-ACP methyl ester carboxylesterase